MKIKYNIGNMERGGRIALGVFLLALIPSGFVSAGFSGGLAVGVGVIAVFAIASGAIGYCPFYHWMGIDTSRRETGRRRGAHHL